MKESFDDILKRRWEERSFPVDDGHREEMIKLLNDQKRRRAFPFWWLGGMAIVLMAVGFLWFTQKNTSPVEQIQPPKDAKHSATSNNTEIAAITGNGNHTESELNVTSSPVAHHGEINFNTEASPKKGNQPLSATEIPSVNKSLKSGPSGKQEKIVSTNAKANPVLTQSTSGVNGNPTSAPADKIYLVDEEAVHSYKIVSKPAVVIVEPEPAMEYNPNIQNAPVVSQRNSARSPMIDPLAMEGILFLHNSQMSSIKPDATVSHSFYVFGELGAGMIFASQPDFSSGWKLRAGGGLGYSLGPKFQMSLGVGYLMQHGGFDFQRTSTVNTQGFGVRSNFNTLTPKTLHFVYTRLGAQYRMHRHMVIAHGGVQYLYGAYGSIVTQTQDQLDPDVEETLTNSWVKTDGLRRFLWSADIAYGYQVTPRLSLMIGSDINFSDITVEDPALSQEGYYWKGAFSTLHPFITLNYLIDGHL